MSNRMKVSHIFMWESEVNLNPNSPHELKKNLSLSLDNFGKIFKVKISCWMKIRLSSFS